MASVILRWLLLSAFIVLVSPHVTCAQEFAFRRYGQQDGLANLSVICLLQDHTGEMWIGTENGLFRHDRIDFERFGEPEGLADTEITTLSEDQSGRLWVGTWHDLYIRTGQRFQPVRPDGHSISVSPGQRIVFQAQNRVLVIDKGELLDLWFTPDDGLWHSRPYFNAEQIRLRPQLTHLRSLYTDTRGGLWLGCGEGICRVVHDHIDVWAARNGVPKDAWGSWFLSGEGRLWVRGQRHVLVSNKDASTFEIRDDPHASRASMIESTFLVQDKQGRVITRSGTGLMRWERNHWRHFTIRDGITTPEISSLRMTRDGTLWLGTLGQGLWQFLGYETIESWSLRLYGGGHWSSVWGILRNADHAITLGTRSGCLQIDSTAHEVQECGIDGLPAGQIQVLARGADDSLWFGMASGPLLRVPAGHQRATLVANIGHMHKLLVDSSGRLWICSDFGLFVVPPGSARAQPITLPSRLGEISDAAEDDSGTLWFATEGGLLAWSNGQASVLRLPTPAREGFSSVATAGHGWLWAGGTSHGLIHVHISKKGVDLAEWISETNLDKAAVYFAQMDSRGWLWLGTDSGVVVFDGLHWRRFTQQDGLIWNDTNQSAVFVDTDGSVWIGTSGGVTHVLRPENLFETTPLDLRIGLATLGMTALKLDAPQRIRWSHELDFDIHLKELDFADPGKALLEVRLRGLSEKWFRTRDFNEHYPGLAPGRYTFEAIAVDTDHRRSSGLVQLSFEILPPWWHTGWFKVLVVALMCPMIAGALAWRIRTLNARRLALMRELEEREALLERATRDGLTKLWNRYAILEILAREMQTARSHGTPLAIALIDVDHFKRVNDTMGHLTGDEVLRTLSTQLSRRIRACDALGRYGGEELLLILPQTLRSRPLLLVERLRRAIEEIPFLHEELTFGVTASFGVAWQLADSDTVEELLHRADEALYLAKNTGRNRVEYAATGS